MRLTRARMCSQTAGSCKHNCLAHVPDTCYPSHAGMLSQAFKGAGKGWSAAATAAAALRICCANPAYVSSGLLPLQHLHRPKGVDVMSIEL